MCDGRSNTHWPGSISGHAYDTPMRLILRKNTRPIRTLSPPEKRSVCSGTRISTT